MAGKMMRGNQQQQPKIKNFIIIFCFLILLRTRFAYARVCAVVLRWISGCYTHFYFNWNKNTVFASLQTVFCLQMLYTSQCAACAIGQRLKCAMCDVRSAMCVCDDRNQRGGRNVYEMLLTNGWCFFFLCFLYTTVCCRRRRRRRLCGVAIWNYY